MSMKGSITDGLIKKSCNAFLGYSGKTPLLDIEVEKGAIHIPGTSKNRPNSPSPFYRTPSVDELQGGALETRGHREPPESLLAKGQIGLL